PKEYLPPTIRVTKWVRADASVPRQVYQCAEVAKHPNPYYLSGRQCTYWNPNGGVHAHRIAAATSLRHLRGDPHSETQPRHALPAHSRRADQDTEGRTI